MIWSTELGPNRLLFGEGSLVRLPELCSEYGMQRVLLVSDPGLEKVGHTARVAQLLEHSKHLAAVFVGVGENPDTSHVENGLLSLEGQSIDGIVALGGGSAMDCAKGINFLYTNGGQMEDYWGLDKHSKPLLPSIGIPTTAGTGSEAQSYALLAQVDTHRKMACGAREARFRSVILDPELLASVPPKVAAISGMDAIGHAVESYVTTNRTPMSQMFAREAFKLLVASYTTSLGPEAGVELRGHMLYGAYLAGCAIEASMLGAAHACANPLTERHEVPHGVAVALMLPAVVRFNSQTSAELYRELLAANGTASQVHDSAALLAECLTQLRSAGGLPGALTECGVTADDLDDLATDAATQWTAGFNPRPPTGEDLRQLYRETL